MESKWFPFVKETEAEQVLFCFYHAGGNASAFRNWVNWADKISVYAVELPGKGSRLGEMYMESVDKLVPEVVEAILEAAGSRKIYLYGHSMGAMIAFEVCRALEEKEGIEVEKLFLSGRQPPFMEGKDEYHTSMPDDMLVRELKRLNGTPAEFLENPALLSFILPSVKADYKLNESFVYKNEKIEASIEAFAGKEDAEASVEIMSGWNEVTNGNFRIKSCSGGHFFPYELGESFYRKIEYSILRDNKK